MAVNTVRPPELMTALDRAGIRFSWLAIAAVVPFAPFLGGVPPVVRYAPFIVSVAVFGLPHGAVDHLVPVRLGDASLWRSVGIVALVYAVLGGLYLGAWFLVPSLAFLAFILMTWAHWGQGDVYALLVFAGADHLRTRLERGLALVIRGGLPMLVPLLSHPAEYREVARTLIGLFGSGASLAPLFAFRTRLIAGAGFLILTLIAIGLGGWRVRGGASLRGWLMDAGETALLWGYFLVIPPIMAIGFYFCFWHSTRHIARLALVDDRARSALSTGNFAGALKRFARDATPMTVAAVAIIAALALVVPSFSGGLKPLFGVYLVGIAVLTLPHVVVVSWMDREQGVW